MAGMRDKYFKGYVKEKRPVGKNGKLKTVYVYHGNYFYWQVSRKTIGQYKWLFGAFTVVGLALMLAISLLNSQASRNVVVMIPVLLALIPLVFQVIGVVQFIRTKEKVPEFDFNEINLKLRYATLINGGLMAVTGVMALVWMFFAGAGQGFGLLGALAAVAAACALVLYFRQKTLGSVMTEKGDYDKIQDARDVADAKQAKNGEG